MVMASETFTSCLLCEIPLLINRSFRLTYFPCNRFHLSGVRTEWLGATHPSDRSMSPLWSFLHDVLLLMKITQDTTHSK